jgi:hypothetical protein
MSLLNRTFTQFSSTTIKSSQWSNTARPMITPFLQNTTGWFFFLGLWKAGREKDPSSNIKPYLK